MTKQHHLSCKTLRMHSKFIRYVHITSITVDINMLIDILFKLSIS